MKYNVLFTADAGSVSPKQEHWVCGVKADTPQASVGVALHNSLMHGMASPGPVLAQVWSTDDQELTEATMLHQEVT